MGDHLEPSATAQSAGSRVYVSCSVTNSLRRRASKLLGYQSIDDDTCSPDQCPVSEIVGAQIVGLSRQLLRMLLMIGLDRSLHHLAIRFAR